MLMVLFLILTGTSSARVDVSSPGEAVTTRAPTGEVLVTVPWPAVVLVPVTPHWTQVRCGAHSLITHAAADNE